MLSGGEQQRVAVARALVMRPSLLLADEPTGDLDEQTADSLHALLREMHQAYGLTSVIATHNPRLAAACDRILRLEGGPRWPVPDPLCPESASDAARDRRAGVLCLARRSRGTACAGDRRQRSAVQRRCQRHGTGVARTGV